jgi:hypothetical protein
MYSALGVPETAAAAQNSAQGNHRNEKGAAEAALRMVCCATRLRGSLGWLKNEFSESVELVAQEAIPSDRQSHRDP